MFKVELKRLLKTRSTWRLTAAALVVCLLFAVWSIRLSVYYYVDDAGTTRFIYGVEGYAQNRQAYAEGEITPELVREAVTVYQEVYGRYGSYENIPPEVLREKLGPYEKIYTWIWCFFSDESGERLTAADVTPEQALGFYQAGRQTLEWMIMTRYPNAPQVLRYVMSRMEEDGGYFRYHYGIASTSAIEHLGIAAFFLALVCAVFAAPVFSAAYASGEDDILRCAKNGKRRLAFTRLGAAMLVSLGIFLLCTGVFLAIVYAVFGFDDHTSAELLGVYFNPNSLTGMGCLWWVILASLLACLAMTGFTLFLSACFRNSLVTLSIAIAVAIVPTFMRMVSLDGNLANWLCFCLPSGGISMAGAMSYELIFLRFLWIGNFVTWSPYVMLTASAVQIPLWPLLAVRTYCRHQAV